MAVRLARANDAPLIRGYLEATPNPPNTNDAQIASLLTEPGWVVMIDTVTKCVAGIGASNMRRSPTRDGAGLGVVDIPWLLPRAAWTVNNVDDIAWVLLAALKRLVAQIPAAANWPCGGEFEGDQVIDMPGRMRKSRELGQFWAARYALDIEVKDHPQAAWIARSEAATVSHLITQFTAYFVAHPHG